MINHQVLVWDQKAWYLKRWRPSGKHRGVGLAPQVHTVMNHPCLHLKQQWGWQRFINSQVEDLLCTLSSWQSSTLVHFKTYTINNHYMKKKTHVRMHCGSNYPTDTEKTERKYSLWFLLEALPQVNFFIFRLMDRLNACSGFKCNIFFCNDVIFFSTQYWTGTPTNEAILHERLVIFSYGKQDVNHGHIISIHWFGETAERLKLQEMHLPSEQCVPNLPALFIRRKKKNCKNQISTQLTESPPPVSASL